MLSSNTSTVHVDGDTGDVRRIVPYSDEWWKLQDKSQYIAAIDPVHKEGDGLADLKMVTIY